jgi:threonine dehydratase
MPPMTTIAAADVAAAAARLRGHLVATPLIGGGLIGDGGVDLRWKPEILQPGGSGWFRGFQHLLLHSYGSLRGVAYAGPISRLLAAAVAAQQHRLPFVAFLDAPLPPALRLLLDALSAQVETVAEPRRAAERRQRELGFLLLPGIEHPEVAAGMATAGLELGQALPAECPAVYCPGEIAAAAAAGLAAAGRTLEVVGVDDRTPADEQATLAIGAAVELGHRLRSGGSSRVLAAALRHRGGGIVGALAVD